VQTQQFSAALTWAARARQYAPQDLPSQLELLDLELSLPAESLRVGPFAGLDRAMCKGDWQAAYDAAVRVGLDSSAAVARLVRLAGYLTEEGAADAALDLLERVLDTQTAEAAVYWQLVRVLTALGRPDQAAEALEVLESLGAAEPLAQAA
jgi:tetratricopeptide (TPR) repeat protein